MTQTLWRCTDDRLYAGPGSCWAQERRDAEAYADNPGFGGPVLIKAEVNPGRVLDLTGTRPIVDLARAVAPSLGCHAADLLDQWLVAYVWEVWETRPEVYEALRREYAWVVYEDNYPYRCTTWLSLTGVPAEAVRKVKEAPPCSQCGQKTFGRCDDCGEPLCTDCREEGDGTCDQCAEEEG